MSDREPSDLSKLFKPASLSYYTSMCRGGTHSVTLDTEECAVVLKAYDYGIWSLGEDEVILLNGVIQKLKDRIHP